MITLKATLVTAPDELRGQLEPLTDFKLIGACAALDTTGDIADPAVAMRLTLATLARRWLQLHEEIKAHGRRLKKLTQTVAPDLIAAFGIGPDIAAEMLVTRAGDNTDRIRSDAAFAKLCGACPIPAGSGKTNGRHRLNRGGTAKPTPLSTGPSSCACGGTHRPSPTSNAARPKASPRRRSSAASSATSPARSTACSPSQAHQPTSRPPRSARLL